MELKITEQSPVNLKENIPSKHIKASVSFGLTLKKQEKNEILKKISNLSEEITAKGEEIAAKMDIISMKEYRNLISQFINEIVVNSHEYSVEAFHDRRGRHGIFGIIKQIDKILDEMTQELLKKEKDNLTILEKTDNIRGLLLDIMI